MGSVRLPKRIYGQWIWKKSLASMPDSVLLMRKKFPCPCTGQDTTLWICANSSYQLFINGRFIGFGPRAHQSEGLTYVDQYDVGYYLESGINVIAVIVSYSVDAADASPGFWCQMEAGAREIIASDDSWSVLDAGCFKAYRPRLSPGQGLSQYFDAELCPKGWALPGFLPDAKWMPPDLVTSVERFRSQLELHPLPPPAVNAERIPFDSVERGVIDELPRWSSVCFRGVPSRNRRCYAAAGHLYSENDADLRIRVFADEPFKFYCDHRPVISGNSSSGEKTILLKLHAGWNRLMLVQVPGYHTLGFTIVAEKEQDAGAPDLTILSEAVETAPAGWSIIGPLRLTLREATSSLRFEHCRLAACDFAAETEQDVGALLRFCRFTAEAEGVADRPLQKSEYRVFRLDCQRYGFLRLELEAAAGDIVDISLGLSREPNGFLRPADHARGSGTLRCRKGVNIYLAQVPGDCLYAMITVRRSAAGVRIVSLDFEELLRQEHHETTFRCSDPLLNRFWEIGRQTLRRSAACVSPADSRPDHDCYLLDAYIDAMNMACVFGDSQYITARLRQFLSSQLENGDIPALANGVRRASQIHHLFFLPLWMYYNYRFTADLVELKQGLPALDLAREFFEAMIDEESGLLRDVEKKFCLNSRISTGNFPENELPTYLNSLFCRFLLSAAEIYRLTDQKGAAEQSLQQAQKVMESLWDQCFLEKEQLFARWRVKAEVKPDCNLFANFCALFSGVLDPEKSFEHFFYTFFNYDPPYDRSEESRSPYFHYLFMEMMFAFGQREWAYRYFLEYWKNRLCDDADAWCASATNPAPAPTRFSDGSCVSPNVFLIREFLGIRIAEAGHSVVYFNPAFKQLEWAEGSVIMARGRIRVKWANQPDGSLSVELDSNMPVKIMPELSHAQLSNTSFQLSDNITLLNPPEDCEA